MSELAEQHCAPCRGGVPALRDAAITQLLKQVEGWENVEDHHIRKEWTFDDFRAALGFVNRVGELAEAEGHHPNIFLTYGRVGIDLYTHKVDGLTESDFVLAAKIDRLPTATAS